MNTDAKEFRAKNAKGSRPTMRDEGRPSILDLPSSILAPPVALSLTALMALMALLAAC